MPYSLEELRPYITEPPPPPPASLVSAYQPTGRAGDDFNARHNSSEVLSWLGFSLNHNDSAGEHWTRPGKLASQGSSATVYKTGEVSIWSSSCLDMWPNLKINHGYDPFGLLVATKFGGDFQAAATDLAANGYGEPSFLGEDSSLIDEVEGVLALEMMPEANGLCGWEPVDLGLAHRLGPPPGPDILRRSDGVALLYRGCLNFAFGPPESSKSWFAQVACLDVWNNGGRFLYIDAENTARAIASHFALLGGDPALMASSGRATYISPGVAWSERAQQILVSAVADRPDLVIVDGMTGAMSLLGRAIESAADFSHFEMEFLRPLMRTGAALLCIDHTPKHYDGKRPSIIGSQHKKAATTGAALFFHPIDKPGRGKKGLVRVYVDKDKPGWLRQYTDDEEALFDFLFTPAGNRIFTEIAPANTSRGWQPRGAMGRVSNYISAHPPLTPRALIDGVSRGYFNAQEIPAAFRVLLETGRLEIRENGTVELLRAYDADEEYFEKIATPRYDADQP